MISDKSFPPLQNAVRKKRDLKWFELLFHLCKKVETAPTRKDFDKAFKLREFKRISKKSQAIIKENYEKMYPKE